MPKNADQQKQARSEYQQECIIDNRHEAILCEEPQRVKMELCYSVNPSRKDTLWGKRKLKRDQ